MKFLTRFGTKPLTVVLVVTGLLALACTSAATPTPTPTSAPTPLPTVTEAPEPTSVPPTVTGSGIEGGDPDFNVVAMIWQGYWLSRDHFGPFVMASGMGEPFMPPPAMMQSAMQMVAQNPSDPVPMIQNMMPLQAVFASGSSDLVNDPREFGPLDLEAFRLDPSTFDKTVAVRAQAETMLKLSQWSHNFSNEHFGTPDDDFGALQRFLG